jgi:hypothetical protein
VLCSSPNCVIVYPNCAMFGNPDFDCPFWSLERFLIMFVHSHCVRFVHSDYLIFLSVWCICIVLYLFNRIVWWLSIRIVWWLSIRIVWWLSIRIVWCFSTRIVVLYISMWCICIAWCLSMRIEMFSAACDLFVLPSYTTKPLWSLLSWFITYFL